MHILPLLLAVQLKIIQIMICARESLKKGCDYLVFTRSSLCRWELTVNKITDVFYVVSFVS